MVKVQELSKKSKNSKSSFVSIFGVHLCVQKIVFLNMHLSCKEVFYIFDRL